MRLWIRRGDKPPDRSTSVRNIQTPTLFGDVRIPDARPRFPHATSLRDLNNAELETLYPQQGFSGFTTVEGYITTWHHEIDYQPPDGSVDFGRIELTDGRSMFEHGIDAAYLEHWWYLASGDDKFLGVRVTRKSAGAERVHELLSVAGDHFVYARNRPKDLPMADSLAALIKSTEAGREQILEYLDCELSHGDVQGGRKPWEIQSSTLPFKEGRQLELASRIQVDPVTGRLSHRGKASEGETWSFPVNTNSTQDLLVLFPQS